MSEICFNQRMYRRHIPALFCSLSVQLTSFQINNFTNQYSSKVTFPSPYFPYPGDKAFNRALAMV